MPLLFEDARPFAQGACPYQHRPLTREEDTNRILVSVKIGRQETLAAVDTGAVWLVCDPEIAELLDLDPGDALEERDVLIRGDRYHGKIYRLPVTFMADEGRGLEWESTAFVPDLASDQRWRWPSFLGFHGCLERVIFAVDPTTDTFYFGSANKAD